MGPAEKSATPANNQIQIIMCSQKKSIATVSRCWSEGPSYKKVSILNLNRVELYEIYFSIIHRLNEARARLLLGDDCKLYGNGTCDRFTDTTTIETLGPIAEKLQIMMEGW